MAKRPLSPELESLIEVFRDAREQLLNIITGDTGVGTKVYYNTILTQLETQLKRMEKQSAYYVKSEIPKEYRKNLDELYSYFKKNNLQMKKPSFFAQIHNDAIHSIANEMQYHIGQGLAQAGRQIERYLNDARDDILRQTGLKATAQKLATGSTVQDMKNNLIERLQNEGFMTVQYGQGKNSYQVSLDAYAQMVSRSTTREAGNLARENQLIENGYDLVEMTTHYPTCEECAKFQGRVYSLSGKDKRFPAIFETAFKSGYRNIHPNCRHVIVPWIEGLQTNDEIKEMISKSNKDFEDNRSDAERDLYSKGQALNRQIRQDKYQYERYKAKLGEDAPKSFHAFRKMKKAGGEKWELIQLDYKRRSKLVENPDLKLPNAESATSADAKFEKYLFNPENKNGYAKGVAFNSRLGYNINNWKELQSEIVKKAPLYPSKHIVTDQYGDKYEQKIIIYGKKEKPANVIVGWQTKEGKTWMSSCYIKGVK